MMINLKLSNNSVELYCDFSYRDRCREIPNGKWNKVKACWAYPLDSLPIIKDVMQGCKVSMDKTIADILHSYEGRNEILQAIKRNEYAIPEHAFLMQHQRACREIAKYYKRFAFFLDTGTGKTLTALQIIEDVGSRFIVICPKANIKSAWIEDQEKFFPNMKLFPLSRNMSKEDYIVLAKKWCVPFTKLSKDAIKKALIEYAQGYIINPESFKSDIKDIEGISGINGIIFDESTIIKNPQSQITKEVTDYAEGLEYAYILTGKPTPNGIMDYFSQMRIVDPCLLGASFFHFKNTYFTPCGYMGYDLRPKPDAEEKIAARIASKSIIISKEDCLDLPDKTYIKIGVTLNNNARKYYNDMEKTQIISILENNISVPNKLACVMKLRQITSGFVMSEDAPIAIKEHSDKLKALDEQLDIIGASPVIIWAQFKEEIRMISKMLQSKGKTVSTAYSETNNLDESIRQFKHGETQYMVAHPKTLKFGVTFVQCTYAIYFSRSYDFEEYYQSHDRIYRKGQVNKCTFIKLIAEDTIDEVIDSVIDDKGDAALLIERMIKKI